MRQFVEYPQLRVCPPHVLAGLRGIEPTADLLYFGRGRWMLGYLDPGRDAIADAAKMLQNVLWLEQISQNNPRFTVNPGHRRRVAGRVEFALLALQGWRVVGERRFQGSPDWSFVNDFERADWLYRHTSDTELFQQLDQPRDQRLAASRAELTDPARGRSAWRWMNTLNIAKGIPLDHKARAARPSSRTLVSS